MGLIRHAAHCTMPQRQLPLHAGIPLPPPPSWRWMGSFSFLLALHFHHPRASCWHPLQQQRSSRSALAAALKTVGKSSKQTRFRTVGKSSTDPSPRQDCRLALNHFNVGWQVAIVPDRLGRRRNRPSVHSCLEVRLQSMHPIKDAFINVRRLQCAVSQSSPFWVLRAPDTLFEHFLSVHRLFLTYMLTHPAVKVLQAPVALCGLRRCIGPLYPSSVAVQAVFVPVVHQCLEHLQALSRQP